VTTALSALLLSAEDRRRVPPGLLTVDFAAEGTGSERLRSLWHHHARFVALRRDGTWGVGAERLSLLKMRIRGEATVAAVYEMAGLGQPQSEGLGLRLTRIEHCGRLLDVALAPALVGRTGVRWGAGRPWSRSEEDWIMDRSVPDRQLAQKFNRTITAINVRRSQIRRRFAAAAPSEPREEKT
jgi:hypothetical protein